jgi:hypothetical protein
VFFAFESGGGKVRKMQDFEQYETHCGFTQLLFALLCLSPDTPGSINDKYIEICRVMNIHPKDGDDFANYMERFVANKYAMSELRMTISQWKMADFMTKKNNRRPSYIADLVALVNAGDVAGAQARADAEEVWYHIGIRYDVAIRIDLYNYVATSTLFALKNL